MKAVGYQRALAINHPEALVDIDLPVPTVHGHDLLVEVKAVSVNPVDTKLRRNPSNDSDVFKVLGFDATGIVKAVGDAVTLFKPGDEVWYCGSIPRNGSNSEFQCVDERIVGRKPVTLGFAEAAALPLTAMTAWELLFDRFGLEPGTMRSDLRLLVTGAAGGVGSAMVQLIKTLLPRATLFATASRPESRAWLERLGVEHVIDHTQPLRAQIEALGYTDITHAASLTHTHLHYGALVDLLAPQGKLGLIDDPATPLDVLAMKRKSLSLHWEFMFTRPFFNTPDMVHQHHILTHLSELVDQSRLVSTMTTHLGHICADNLREAHRQIESGSTIGKIVLEGF